MEHKVIEKDDVILVKDEEIFLAVANGEWNVMGHKEILYYKVHPLNGKYRSQMLRTVQHPKIIDVIREYPEPFPPGTQVTFGHRHHDKGTIISYDETQGSYKIDMHAKKHSHTYIDKGTLMYYNPELTVESIEEILKERSQRKIANAQAAKEAMSK